MFPPVRSDRLTAADYVPETTDTYPDNSNPIGLYLGYMASESAIDLIWQRPRLVWLNNGQLRAPMDRYAPLPGTEPTRRHVEEEASDASFDTGWVITHPFRQATMLNEFAAKNVTPERIIELCQTYGSLHKIGRAESNIGFETSIEWYFIETYTMWQKELHLLRLAMEIYKEIQVDEMVNIQPLLPSSREILNDTRFLQFRAAVIDTIPPRHKIKKKVHREFSKRIEMENELTTQINNENEKLVLNTFYLLEWQHK